ncbi:membrane fusogenic activity family protein [Nocardiopsis sp. LOL_012]|uniref:membrane fusogenic activity family protein n=1 Tax=Nocardiopsis sp. LOL_012 TaxID=3345409 RepID=UPI003A8BE23B
MVVDAVRTYLDAASGLTELSRKDAVTAAKALLRAEGTAAPAPTEHEAPPPRLGQSIQALAGELIETNRSNRSAIADLVRAEVGRQLERMDVVPRTEHDRLVRRTAELERRLAARQGLERPSAQAEGATASGVRPVPSDGGAAPLPAGEAAGAETGTDGAEAEEEPDTAAMTGARSAPGDGGGEGEDGDAKQHTAKKPAPRAKPRTAAKSTPKPARSRSTAKRKGPAKK